MNKNGCSLGGTTACTIFITSEPWDRWVLVKEPVWSLANFGAGLKPPRGNFDNAAYASLCDITGGNQSYQWRRSRFLQSRTCRTRRLHPHASDNNTHVSAVARGLPREIGAHGIHRGVFANTVSHTMSLPPSLPLFSKPSQGLSELLGHNLSRMSKLEVIL
jgi:hypothetical protein